MEFRHLLSFLAVADELHFGRAAAKVHLAQPSLSQHLRRLERELGVQLMERTSHDVRLTPAGRVFQVEARRLVDQANRAVAAVQDTAAGRTGWIRIGFNLPAAERVLQPALVKLSSTNPGVATHLWEQGSAQQLTGLLKGQLDVGFIYGPPPTGDLRSREIIRIRLVAIVGDHHEWAGRDKIAFRELGEQPCMLCRRETSPAMYDTILSCAQRAKITLQIATETDDPAGARLRLVTRPMTGIVSMERAKALKGVVAIPIVDPVPALPLRVVWRPTPNRAVTALLDSVDAVLAEGTGTPAPDPGRIPGARDDLKAASWPATGARPTQTGTRPAPGSTKPTQSGARPAQTTYRPPAPRRP
jgi:DNA-binding transcriptional LysR family regulator